MIKKLVLENWKSFRHAELYIDPLTVLIGTNASGKSNLVESLEFLKRIASGETIDVALNGDHTLSSIRGGSQQITYFSLSNFILQVEIQEEEKELVYTIKALSEPDHDIIYISEESLSLKKHQCSGFKKSFFLLSEMASLYNKSGLVKRFFSPYVERFREGEIVEDRNILENSSSPNSELSITTKAMLLKGQLRESVVNHLKKMAIINPIANKMRNFSRLSESLEQDTSNIAGVLAALPEEKKTKVEAELTHYLEHLPEGDIKKVWAEKVGRLGTDAMLYCQEEWRPGEIMEIDARSMSDGTLRFIGILTALLTCSEGSLIIIEEIDNGLHPSRAELLVKTLREIGAKRTIDLLITTHNPALLDALGPEIIPFVTVAHRDPETGESKLTLLENIDHLPKLLSQGSLGTLATKGAIEKRLANAGKYES